MAKFDGCPVVACKNDLCDDRRGCQALRQKKIDDIELVLLRTIIEKQKKCREAAEAVVDYLEQGL